MTLEDYLNTCSQADLANRLNVSQGLISHWVTGRVRITAENAITIESATNGQVTAKELRPDLFGPKSAA